MQTTLVSLGNTLAPTFLTTALTVAFSFLQLLTHWNIISATIIYLNIMQKAKQAHITFALNIGKWHKI